MLAMSFGFCTFVLGMKYEHRLLMVPCYSLVEESSNQRINESSEAWMDGFQAGQARGYSEKITLVDEDGNTITEHRWVKLGSKPNR
jgi:hypothetical protein